MEPVFVPRKRRAAAGASDPSAAPAAAGEDDGFLLCTVYDAAAGRGTLCIFDVSDGRRLSAGPVARIRLPHHLPSGLHGSWSGAFFGEEDGSGAPKWREPNRIRAL